MIADTVQVTRVGAPPPMAIFTQTLPARDRYLVYARWYCCVNCATDAPLVMQHEGGSTTVRVNQVSTAYSKTWVLLGTYMMAPGGAREPIQRRSLWRLARRIRRPDAAPLHDVEWLGSAPRPAQHDLARDLASPRCRRPDQHRYRDDTEASA